MHFLVIDAMPDAKILMMPQTVFFSMKKMHFVSLRIIIKLVVCYFWLVIQCHMRSAKELFSKVSVKIFPDIVTTLIGLRQYDNPRSGVCLCTRNDDEKLYSYEDLDTFRDKIR